MYSPRHAGVKRTGLADRQAGKSKWQPQLTSLRLARSEVLRGLKHYLQTQGQGQKITPSIAWMEAWKEQALDDRPWKDEKGPHWRRKLKPFQRGAARNNVVFSLVLFFPERRDTILIWTEPEKDTSCRLKTVHAVSRPEEKCGSWFDNPVTSGGVMFFSNGTESSFTMPVSRFVPDKTDVGSSPPSPCLWAGLYQTRQT